MNGGGTEAWSVGECGRIEKWERRAMRFEFVDSSRNGTKQTWWRWQSHRRGWVKGENGE